MNKYTVFLILILVLIAVLVLPVIVFMLKVTLITILGLFAVFLYIKHKLASKG